MGDLWIGGDEGEGIFGHAADARVTDLGRHQASRDFPAIEQVLGYWSSLARSSGRVPYRKQIEPRALSGALPMTFLLESVAPGVARFRVAGSQICDLMGMEVRGMPLISIFAPKFRDDISDALQTVLSKLAQAQLTLVGEGGFGRPPLDARLLILPLCDDLGRPTRALGALEAKGQIGRTPRRFEISASRIALLRVSALTDGKPGGDPAGRSPAPPKKTAATGWRGREALASTSDATSGGPPKSTEPTPNPWQAPPKERQASAQGFAEPAAGFDAKPPNPGSAGAEPPSPPRDDGETRPRPWLRVIKGGKE